MRDGTHIEDDPTVRLSPDCLHKVGGQIILGLFVLVIFCYSLVLCCVVGNRHVCRRLRVGIEAFEAVRDRVVRYGSSSLPFDRWCNLLVPPYYIVLRDFLIPHVNFDSILRFLYLTLDELRNGRRVGIRGYADIDTEILRKDRGSEKRFYQSANTS